MSTSSEVSTDFLPADEVEESDGSGRSLGADLVVKGRNVEVPDHFRVHVADKLSRLERFDLKVQIYDVELQHERNKRQSKAAQRVEITARGKGPVVRAEARADSFYAALELAIAKLEGRLRKTKDRRTVSYGDKTPVSVAVATAELAKDDSLAISPEFDLESEDYPAGPGQVVRTKDHPSTPMAVDDALYEMELVGHDFFLFQDAATNKPSVVYRRHAFDYGLIRLA